VADVDFRPAWVISIELWCVMLSACIIDQVNPAMSKSEYQ
jgi:hypothetical protein